MRKFILLLLYTVSSLYQPTLVYAEVTNTQCETQINCTVRGANRPPGTNSNRPVTGFTSTETGAQFGLTGKAESGAYSQAQEAKTQANNTKTQALMMAAMFMAMCSPKNPMPCMLAAAALAAAGVANGKKNDAQRLMNDLGTGQDTVGRNDETPKTDGSTNTDADLTKLQTDLAGKGYKVNTNGSVTLPNGQTVGSDFSEQSMLDAGMTTAQAASVTEGLSKLRSDMNKPKDEGVSDLGRVSLSSMGSSPETSGGGTGTSVNGADKVEAGRDPASWDGFYKQFGDSLIGVGQNDIFLMVEQRVEKERKLMGQ